MNNVDYNGDYSLEMERRHMMKENGKDRRIVNYVWQSYLLFWGMVLLICGGASLIFHAGPLTMRILSNICAWSPTILLLTGHQYFLRGKGIKAFYREAFAGEIRYGLLFTAALLTLSATILAVLVTGVLEKRSFASFWSMGGYSFLASFLFSITTGPTGEESGWRGYLRPLLNERFDYVRSCTLQGVIWAFWHTVLWFVDSDFTGLDLIPYVLSNVIVMTGLCFIMNLVMNRYNNLIYGIVIHFCFNFLYCFLHAGITFYMVLSAIYLLLIGFCIVLNQRGEARAERL